MKVHITEKATAKDIRQTLKITPKDIKYAQGTIKKVRNGQT